MANKFREAAALAPNKWQRITNCGHEHEQPANPQEWRTARD